MRRLCSAIGSWVTLNCFVNASGKNALFAIGNGTIWIFTLSRLQSDVYTVKPAP